MQCAGGTLEARMRDGMPSFAMEQCAAERPSVWESALRLGRAGLFMDRPLPFAAEPSALSRGICLLHYCPLYNRPVLAVQSAEAKIGWNSPMPVIRTDFTFLVERMRALRR